MQVYLNLVDRKGRKLSSPEGSCKESVKKFEHSQMALAIQVSEFLFSTQKQAILKVWFLFTGFRFPVNTRCGEGRPGLFVRGGKSLVIWENDQNKMKSDMWALKAFGRLQFLVIFLLDHNQIEFAKLVRSTLSVYKRARQIQKST